MPSVLDQFQPCADSTSGRAEGPSRYIFRYFNGHFAVTTQHLRQTWRKTFRHFRRCASPKGEFPQLALPRYPLLRRAEQLGGGAELHHLDLFCTVRRPRFGKAAVTSGYTGLQRLSRRVQLDAALAHLGQHALAAAVEVDGGGRLDHDGDVE